VSVLAVVPGDIHYRYEDVHAEEPPKYFASIDWGKPDEYEVLRLTPAGYWVRQITPYPDLGLGMPERFVLASAGKKRVQPTKELAWDSFCRRKKAQKKILEAQLSRVNETLRGIKARAQAKYCDTRDGEEL